MIQADQTRLKAACRQLENSFDYCIIDCAPDINISTINALVASDYVLIPIKIDNFAFDGLAELIEQIENVREDFNPDIKYRCFVTCYQNNEVNRQGEEWLKERRNDYPLFNTHIRRTVKLTKAPLQVCRFLNIQSGAVRQKIIWHLLRKF